MANDCMRRIRTIQETITTVTLPAVTDVGQLVLVVSADVGIDEI